MSPFRCSYLRLNPLKVGHQIGKLRFYHRTTPANLQGSSQFYSRTVGRVTVEWQRKGDGLFWWQEITLD